MSLENNDSESVRSSASVTGPPLTTLAALDGAAVENCGVFRVLVVI